MRSLVLVALVSCTADVATQTPNAPPVRYHAAALPDADAEWQARIRAREQERLAADRAEQAREEAAIAAAKAASAQEDARRKAEADEQRRRVEQAQVAQAQAHADECKQSYAGRLKTAQGLLGQAVTKKAEIVGHCQRLQSRCAISGTVSACAGVSQADAQFFQETCMNLQYADQIMLIDESDECADVDTVPLRVTLRATPAELAAIRNAKP